MADTLYHHTERDGRHEFTVADDGVVLGEHDRHILSGQLYRQLTSYHRAVTGPRNSIGADSTHNTVDAAAALLRTLEKVSRKSYETFLERYSHPHRWTYGPRVNSKGYLVEGLYSKQQEPPVSPPAYRPPCSGEAPAHRATERDVLVDDALYKHLLPLAVAGFEATVERECPSCGLTLRATSKERTWKHLAGEPADPCPFV